MRFRKKFASTMVVGSKVSPRLVASLARFAILLHFLIRFSLRQSSIYGPWEQNNQIVEGIRQQKDFNMPKNSIAVQRYLNKEKEKLNFFVN